MEQPLYLMAKPPFAGAKCMDSCRAERGIDRSYDLDRLHMTLLRLGEGRAISQAELDALCEVLTVAMPEPFAIVLDRLWRNTLYGSRLGHVLALRRDWEARLVRAGLPVIPHGSRPHVTLAYGQASGDAVRIDPIDWPVTELLLVRSIRGAGRHEVLHRWPLAPRQGRLFD